MPSRFLLSVLLLSLLASSGRAFENKPANDTSQISYLRDVRPILRRHCWGCHSGGDAKGGLDVSTVSSMLKGGDSGPLFAAGKPDNSLIMDMVAGDQPAMPPKAPFLSAEQLAVITAWISAGAVDDSNPQADASQVIVPEVYDRAPAVTGLSFDPAGTTLAAACRSEVVLIPLPKDPPSKEQAEKSEPSPVPQPVVNAKRLATHAGLLTHVEFSPDGKTLAAAGGTPSQFGLVTFFSGDGKQTLAERQVGFDTLFRGSFSPSGSEIALGGADGGVYVVPVNAQEEVRHFDLHSDWVMDVAYSPDGKYLVTGGRDKATKVSSAETGDLLRAVDSTDELVSSVAASDAFAVSAGRSRLMAAYQFEVALSGIEIRGMGGNGSRPVNKRPQYTKNFETPSGQVLDLATSGDRNLVAAAGTGPDIRVYELATQKRVALIKAPGTIYSLALDTTGTRLAAGCRDGSIHLYALPSGEEVISFVPVPVK